MALDAGLDDEGDGADGLARLASRSGAHFALSGRDAVNRCAGSAMIASRPAASRQ